jgi:ADP-heptose:LPS heptosyltransferase
MIFRTECRHYLGDKPCVVNRLCEGCGEFVSSGPRVLIVKTAAAGDVLRTTSLLPGLRRELENPHISWLTLPVSVDILRGNTAIDRIIPFDAAAYPALAAQRFDLLVCLDKEPGPAGLASMVAAGEKRGVGLSACGTPIPLNPSAEYYFALGVSDELKFKENKRSYHELIYEAAELDYMRDEPAMYLEDVELGLGRQEWRRLNVDPDAPIIGINTGAGSRFTGKAQSVSRAIELIEEIKKLFSDETIALLGGPLEEQKNREIAERAGGRVVNVGCRHTVRQFASILKWLSVLITGDTLAMHIATCLQVPTVALFGPTVAVEVDLFGRGDTLISPKECVPCYRAECEQRPQCIDAIPLEEILRSVGKYL